MASAGRRVLRLLGTRAAALAAGSSSSSSSWWWGAPAAAACSSQGPCGSTQWPQCSTSIVDVQQARQHHAAWQQCSSDAQQQPLRRPPEGHSAPWQQPHSSSCSAAVPDPHAARAWRRQQPGPWQLQARRCLHVHQEQQPPKQQKQPPKQQQQQQQQQQNQQQRRRRAPGASWVSLPNVLSLSRAASGPVVAHLIVTQQWPAAVALTATAGLTDWADGYVARRLGHTSKLGSYLDPAADKLMIGCVVAALSWQQLLPAWLAALVLGRDAVQFAGMAAYRLRMFRGAWPGAAAFFDVDGSPAPARSGSSSSSSSSSEAAPAGGGGLPAMRPLLVSKANTALIFVLVGGCMTQQWLGLPGQGLLDVLEVAIAGTTAASAAAYAAMYAQGRLLPGARSSVRR